MRRCAFLLPILLCSVMAGCGSPAVNTYWQIVDAYRGFNDALASLGDKNADADAAVAKIEASQERMLQLIKKLAEMEKTMTDEERQTIQQKVVPVLEKEKGRTMQIVQDISKKNPLAILKIAGALSKLKRTNVGKGAQGKK